MSVLHPDKIAQAVVLEETTHVVLANDAEFNASGPAAQLDILCASGAATEFRHEVRAQIVASFRT